MRSVIDAVDSFLFKLETLPISLVADFRPASTVDRVLTRLRFNLAASVEAKDAVVSEFFDRWKLAMERSVEDHIYADGKSGEFSRKDGALRAAIQADIAHFSKNPKDLLFPPKIG